MLVGGFCPVRRATFPWGYRTSRGLSLPGLWFWYCDSHLHKQATEDLAARRLRRSRPHLHLIQSREPILKPQQQAPDDGKRLMREAALTRRSAAARAAGPDAASALATIFLSAVALDAGAVVAGYMPIKDEIDPRPLMAQLGERGCGLALPAIDGRADSLVFRVWAPGDAFEAGPFGTRQPEPDAQPVRPAVVLVPMLAFDGAGNRLGYGKGYYDRALATLRGDARPVVAAGLAYAAQRVDAVPATARDQRLDWIVTERGAQACR